MSWYQLTAMSEPEEKQEGVEIACPWCGKHVQHLKVCSGCKLAFYCGTECQRADWKHVHKKTCKKVSAYNEFVLQKMLAAFHLLSDKAFKLCMDAVRLQTQGATPEGNQSVPKQRILIRYVDTQQPNDITDTKLSVEMDAAITFMHAKCSKLTGVYVEASKIIECQVEPLETIKPANNRPGLHFRLASWAKKQGVASEMDVCLPLRTSSPA